MRNEIISRYSVIGKTEDLIYVPKVNTDLFREGNGIPVLKREVHSYIDKTKRYRQFGCDSSHEHECQLCKYPYKFNRSIKAYLAVAVLEKDSISNFRIELMSLPYGEYIEEFRDLLLTSEDGVYLKITYPDVDNPEDKIKGRTIEVVSNELSFARAKFEEKALKELKSLDMIDIQSIRQEFRKTSYDTATVIVYME